MGLADTLSTPPKRKRKGPQCLVCKLLEHLPPKESDAFAAALDDVLRWESTQLARVMQAEGHDVSPYSIGRHRREECAGTR